VRYGCVVVEVEETALATYLELAAASYSARLEQHTRVRRMDLTDLEAVEAELRRHLDDLAALDVVWKVVPWQ
jgi:hypothetical protein